MADDWDAIPVELRRFERTAAGGVWTAVGDPVSAVVGTAGLGWGRGLHGELAPPNQPGPVKAEGDGRTPAGVFRIGHAFGYAATTVAGSRLPYDHVTDSWRCVDDPTSIHYNRVFDSAGVDEDWSSAERMRRRDELYERGIVIDHNHGLGTPEHPGPAPAPRGGSCIFFHVWRGKGGATIGCTALARPELEALIAWLDPGAEPVYVLLPRDRYTALMGDWGLPSLSE